MYALPQKRTLADDSWMSALCQYQTLPDIIRSLVSGKKSVAGDAVLAAAIAAWLWCRN
jgi:hypothetical protein